MTDVFVLSCEPRSNENLVFFNQLCGDLLVRRHTGWHLRPLGVCYILCVCVRGTAESSASHLQTQIPVSSDSGKQNTDKPPDKWIIFSFCSLVPLLFFLLYAFCVLSCGWFSLPLCVGVRTLQAGLLVCDNLWLEDLAKCEKANWIYGSGPSDDSRWRTFCCMLNGLSAPPWREQPYLCVRVGLRQPLQVFVHLLPRLCVYFRLCLPRLSPAVNLFNSQSKE